MSAMAIGDVFLRVRMCWLRTTRALTLQRCLPALFAGLLISAASPLWAQTFEPTVTVGAGIQSSYQHVDPKVGNSLDQFSLNHARLYLSGAVIKDVGVV